VTYVFDSKIKNKKQNKNKQTNKRKKERMVEKKRKRKRQEMSAAAGQRLDTCNPCTRYNPFSWQQHGRAKDAHELHHTKTD